VRLCARNDADGVGKVEANAGPETEHWIVRARSA
jgi:hypothetical protein